MAHGGQEIGFHARGGESFVPGFGQFKSARLHGSFQ